MSPSPFGTSLSPLLILQELDRIIGDLNEACESAEEDGKVAGAATEVQGPISSTTLSMPLISLLLLHF